MHSGSHTYILIALLAHSALLRDKAGALAAKTGELGRVGGGRVRLADLSGRGGRKAAGHVMAAKALCGGGWGGVADVEQGEEKEEEEGFGGGHRW